MECALTSAAESCPSFRAPFLLLSSRGEKGQTLAPPPGHLASCLFSTALWAPFVLLPPCPPVRFREAEPCASSVLGPAVSSHSPKSISSYPPGAVTLSLLCCTPTHTLIAVAPVAPASPEVLLDMQAPAPPQTCCTGSGGSSTCPGRFGKRCLSTSPSPLNRA